MKNGLKKTVTEKMTDLILKILLALKMAPKDKDLQEIYNLVFSDALRYTDQFNIQMVAATYIAIAMRLYKTSLTPQEYEMMVQTIMEAEVKPYNKNGKETIH
jgi:hypothetical protein